MSDERIDKLPKWAQKYIRKLERDNEGLRKERESVEQGTSPIKYHMYWGQEYYLPERTTVNMAGIEFYLRDGWVCVRGLNGRLTVHPEASNVIRVQAGGWGE